MNTFEKNQDLWMMAVSPAVWAVHFLLCYITASIWCSKAADPDARFWYLLAAIIVFTVLALAAVALIGWIGYRRHSFGGGAAVPHDDDTPEDRHRFLGFATLLTSALSAVAVLYASLVVLFFRNCN